MSQSPDSQPSPIPEPATKQPNLIPQPELVPESGPGLSIPDMVDITEVDEEGEQYMASFQQRMDTSTDHLLQAMDSFQQRMNTSTDHLLQAMENVDSVDLYGTGSDLNDLELNSGGFLSMNGDTITSEIFFTDTGKRPLKGIDEDVEEDDEEEDEEDIVDLPTAKRMRSETDNWTYEQPSPFDACLAKAQELYNEKGQEVTHAQMQMQYLTTVIQEKDQVIHQLGRSRFEDQQKYNAELSRYEQEMNIMAQLVSGYKHALKQARHKFSEYRKKYPEVQDREKRVYGDVPNGGGLVICIEELERQKLERQIEMKQVAVSLISQFQKEWLENFEVLKDRVSQLERRAGGLIVGINGCEKKEESKESLPSVEGTDM